ATTVVPGDAARAGEVSRGFERDGGGGGAGVAAHTNRQGAHSHGGRNSVDRLSAALPDDRARGEIVAAHTVGSVDDHLRAAVVFDRQRRSPGSWFVASYFPARLAGACVENGEKGADLLVPVDDECVAVKRGRSA